MEKREGIKHYGSAMIRGLILSAVLSAFLILAVAFVMMKFSPGDTLTGWMVFGIYFFASLSGGTAAGRRAGSRRFVWGLCLGILYYLGWLLLSLSTVKSVPTDLTHAWITGGICMLGGMAGGILSGLFAK